ncbi:hypothetical protein [Plantactinospora sp. WMMB782]|uniref:hypothetical protein n=1 Tax=Plantactinospora sp. WMMB782 TaxID=3404121 RepID=UPI003B93624C
MTTTERTCRECGKSLPPKPNRTGPAPEFCDRTCRAKLKHRRTYTPTPRAVAMPSRQKHKPSNTYGSLTLVERIESRNGEPFARFRCECGNVKELRISNVSQGLTSNCGDRASHPDSRIRDRVGYDGAHMRIRSRRGSASRHTCRCGKQAEHWAYTHADYDQSADKIGREAGRPYSMAPAFYVPMCRPCHVRWDNARARMGINGISLVHRALWMATVGDEVQEVTA